MHIEVDMRTDQEKFTVHGWYAREPDFVITALQQQLEAASAIWPELKKYAIREAKEG